MKIIHRRFASDKVSSLSIILIGGQFVCWALEDRYNVNKVKGETRIPPGEYKIKLRTDGLLHEKYKKKFPEIHKGMLEITGIPGFSRVYYHIGNKHQDSLGCPLVGTLPIYLGNEWQVRESTIAYLKFYPLVLAGIKDVSVLIEDTDI